MTWEAEQKKYYDALSTSEKKRFWIALSQNHPQDYARMEQILKPATKAAREWVECWRPHAQHGADTG